MRRLGVVILLTALAGCTAARGPTVAGQPFEPQGMSGSIIVNGMTRADPLHERGVSRLGVAVVESSRIHVANVALTIFGNTDEPADFSECLGATRLTDAFVESINRHEGYTAISLANEAAAIDQHTKTSFWDGSVLFDDTPDAQAYLGQLRAAYDIDAVLFVVEEPFVADFIGETAVGIGPKGLYARMKKDHFAYAAFKTTILDLGTGEQVKHSQYPQGSYWGSGPIDWTVPWTEQTAEVKRELCQRLQALDAHNVALATWMLRIDPAREAPAPEYDPDL